MFFPRAHLKPSSLLLQTYTAESLALLGTMKVGSLCGQHVLFVVSGMAHILLGHDWLITIRLNWQSLGVATLQSTSLTLKSVIDKYSDVFKKFWIL